MQLEADLQLVIEASADATGRLGVNLFLARRSPADVSAAGFQRTSAGVRCPLYRCDELAEAIQVIAKRAAEAALMAPLASGS